jgi:predicted anti-sigma-YlaC factor YlaD
MTAHLSSVACDRAREWASRSLDAELSQFEQALLDAHLDRCGGCRTFAVEVEGLTRALRAAELEAVRLAVRSRSRPVRARAAQLSAAAALVLAAAGLGGAFGTLSGGPAPDGVGPVAFRPAVAAPTGDPLLRDLRLATLLHTADDDDPSVGARKPPLPVTL